MKKGPPKSLKGINCILGPQRQISRMDPANTPLMKDKIEELETSQLMYRYSVSCSVKKSSVEPERLGKRWLVTHEKKFLLAICYLVIGVYS